ncbi:MAG: elongation factor Ts [Spirochaetales bacterium]|nr:elongation factor Ts [Spirochaetales bacterium]
MEIKATQVKELRELTGAGMMDCKKALVDSGGDFKKAVKMLKELGLAAARKRDGKATKEGKVFIKMSGNKGIILELYCETDFVAKNKDFIELGEKCLSIIDEKNLETPDATLDSCVKDIQARIKENLGLKRFKVVHAKDDELLVDYTHGEGRIGVIIKFKLGNPGLKTNEKVKETAFDCALHVAAYAPLYLDRNAVDAEYLKEQEEIFQKQAENLGKPANVVQGIVKGKISKHLAEICFVDQNFVKNEKYKVSEVLKNLSKEVGGDVSIVEYLYYRLGE